MFIANRSSLELAGLPQGTDSGIDSLVEISASPSFDQGRVNIAYRKFLLNNIGAWLFREHGRVFYENTCYKLFI